MAAAGCADGGTGGAGPEESERAPVACTRASGSGVAVVRLRRVPADASSAEVCVDGRCQEVRRPVGGEVRVALAPENRSGGPDVRQAEATAEARDRAGAPVARGFARIRLSALRPNGALCTPTCWGGRATLSAAPARRGCHTGRSRGLQR